MSRQSLPNQIANALDKALSVDFPDVYEPTNLGYRRPRESDLCVVAFSQHWPNTNCGFGGIAGHAITHAYTVVLHLHRKAVVYVGGRLAYTIIEANDHFLHDMRQRQMAPATEGVNRYELLIPVS